MTMAVLTAPGMLYKRLVPLLESSLRNERDIVVFFKDNYTTLEGREALRRYLRRVNREQDVTIVALKPIENMLQSLRNAWVNLPAVKWLHENRPRQEWFAFMDDDTYFLMNAIRRILREAELNETLRSGPAYIGAPLVDGRKGTCRVLRKGHQLYARSSAKRVEVQFVCGGSGILFNHRAIDAILPVIDHCISTMFQPAGDVRLGHCMAMANVSIHPRREMFRDTLFRAIGEKGAHNKYLFPASFHRFRKREWQYALANIERLRQPNELVTWGDLIKNFRPGPVYWHSMFYPEKYENYSIITGIRKKTPHEIKRENIIFKRFKCKRKQNTDEW
jgi:hypothetical protein